jgi:hypothetical protein
MSIQISSCPLKFCESNGLPNGKAQRQVRRDFFLIIAQLLEKHTGFQAAEPLSTGVGAGKQNGNI